MPESTLNGNNTAPAPYTGTNSPNSGVENQWNLVQPINSDTAQNAKVNRLYMIIIILLLYLNIMPIVIYYWTTSGSSN